MDVKKIARTTVETIQRLRGARIVRGTERIEILMSVGKVAQAVREYERDSDSYGPAEHMLGAGLRAAQSALRTIGVENICFGETAAVCPGCTLTKSMDFEGREVCTTRDCDGMEWKIVPAERRLDPKS